MKYELVIPRWKPVALNSLMYKHYFVASRLKKEDMKLIAGYWKYSGLPDATTRRRVSLLIRLKPRGRRTDPDALWKVLLDGLVLCGALVEDNDKWCELGTVEYERGTAADWSTSIILEDLE